MGHFRKEQLAEGSSVPTDTEGWQRAAPGLGKSQIQATTLIGYFIPASIRIKAQAAEEYVDGEMLGISLQDLFVALRKGKQQTPGH